MHHVSYSPPQTHPAALLGTLFHGTGLKFHLPRKGTETRRNFQRLVRGVILMLKIHLPRKGTETWGML